MDIIHADTIIALTEEDTWKGQYDRINKLIDQMVEFLMVERSEYNERVARICSNIKELERVKSKLSMSSEPILLE